MSRGRRSTSTRLSLSDDIRSRPRKNAEDQPGPRRDRYDPDSSTKQLRSSKYEFIAWEPGKAVTGNGRQQTRNRNRPVSGRSRKRMRYQKTCAICLSPTLHTFKTPRHNAQKTGENSAAPPTGASLSRSRQNTSLFCGWRWQLRSKVGNIEYSSATRPYGINEII